MLLLVRSFGEGREPAGSLGSIEGKVALHDTQSDQESMKIAEGV